ncbi:MAG: GSCFA domain-containing protein [Gilvibacter sp.]
MKWTTPVSIPEQHALVNYSAPTVFMGSCFSEHIAAMFRKMCLPSHANPFGIVFHPLAIERLITFAVNQQEIGSEDIFENNGIWNSFLAHSKMYGDFPGEFSTTLNGAVRELHHNLVNARHLVITYGTAWVYRHIESDQIVANCHKLPNKRFLKELLSPDQVAQSLEASIALVKTINPEIIVITTVSPVRHIKDGLVENARSKAHLLAGIHDAIAPKDNVHYFPAYEIMMDELRDYRFYKQDLIHPNEQAISFIWEKFKAVWFATETITTLNEVSQLKAAMAHKPIHPNSSNHKEFERQLAQKLAHFRAVNPHIDL